MIGDQLQRAIFTALTVADVADGRVYDRPTDAKRRLYPNIVIGDEQAVDDGNSCEDAWEVSTDVHVWSRPDDSSFVEAKNLVAEIVPVLAVPLTLTGFRVVSAKLESARYFRDPDGITVHGVASFLYLIDPA